MRGFEDVLDIRNFKRMRNVFRPDRSGYRLLRAHVDRLVMGKPMSKYTPAQLQEMAQHVKQHQATPEGFRFLAALSMKTGVPTVLIDVAISQMAAGQPCPFH